jgi:hypothetical protein
MPDSFVAQILTKKTFKKLREYYLRFVEKELGDRAQIAANYSDKITYCTRNLKMLGDRDNVGEDENECHYCINLCYASFVS